VFNGFIAGAAIYNHKLTEAQLQQMFIAATGIGQNGFPPAFVTQPATNTTTFPGKTVQITARVASATTPITNQWKLNNVSLTDGTFNGVTIIGSQSNVLTIAHVTTNWAGVYNLVVGNQVATITSSNAILTVASTMPPPAGTLVGQWFAGVANMADSSGYSPAGIHDGYTVGGTSYMFTNDAPPGLTGPSLYLNNMGIMISNSSSLDLNYTNTFDDLLYTNQFTVTCWVKGTPSSWNAFVSKQGETQGWQLRVDNSSPPRPSFNICNGGVNAGSAQSTTAWHHYAVTWNVSGNTRQLYVDGNLAGTATGGAYTPNSQDHLMISGREDTHRSGGYGLGDYFIGEMYDVRIYKSALSTAQINYLIPVVVAPPTLSSSIIPGSGGNPGKIVLSWSNGTLMEATNMAGPWVTNAAQTSPVTNPMTKQSDFFKVSNP